MMRRFLYTVLAGFIVLIYELSFSLITFAAEFTSGSIQKQHGMEIKGKIYVNSYKCDKYLITYKDKSMGTMTQWISKKINYPIKMVYHSSYSDMYTE